MPASNLAAVREDFDAIARLSDPNASGSDRYDAFLASQLPARAMRVLEIGCGLGRLASRIAAQGRDVLGVDVSPEMIARARTLGTGTSGLRFECCDFFDLDPGAGRFDGVLSAAVLHHMDAGPAIAHMVRLLAPGGRLVLHDLRADENLVDRARSGLALAHRALGRLARTGRLRSPKVVREAWARHGAGEVYLTLREARALAARLLPGARVHNHWLWRYTIVWDGAGLG